MYPIYNFHVWSPYDEKKYNNCGYKCIEYIFKNKLNYHQERKDIKIKTGEFLTEPQLIRVYNKYNNDNKQLIIINKEYDGTINLNENRYIILHNNHYYVLVNIEYKHFKDEKTKEDIYIGI